MTTLFSDTLTFFPNFHVKKTHTRVCRNQQSRYRSDKSDNRV
jgi:hypothetical protein